MTTNKHTCVQNNDYINPIWLKNDGTKVDISGYTFSGELYNADTNTKVCDFTVDDSLLASDYIVKMTLPKATTNDLSYDVNYYYYYHWIDDNSKKLTFLMGEFEVLKGVTE